MGIHAPSGSMRRFAGRFLQVLPASALLCFTFLFFGPYETVAFNVQSFSYHHSDILVPLLAASLIASLSLSFVSMLLPSRLFRGMVSLVFSTALCIYVQAAFFNGGLGRLTGDAVDWSAQRPMMLLSFAVWLLIFVIVFLLMYRWKHIWRAAILYVSLLLIFMQSVPAVCICLGVYENTNKPEIASYTLQTSGMYEFSKEKNVLVFVLDRLDNEYVEDVLAGTPDLLDDFDGFTRYTNATSSFVQTRPGLASILSGCADLAYQVPPSVYYSESWTHGGRHILRDIQAQNCSIELYAQIEDMLSDPEMAMAYVQNISDGHDEVLPVRIIKRMVLLSCYRFAPIALKPFFLRDTNYYNADVFASDVYTFNDAKYGAGFAEIEASRNHTCFKLIHLNGSHTPYTLTAGGTISDYETNVHDQTKGCFMLLKRAFSRMKELGIYKDAAIIITGDHGHTPFGRIIPADPSTIGLFYKPSGNAGTPLAISHAPVSTENIPSTILKNLGTDYSAYDRALDEIAEDEILTRVYYRPDERASGYAVSTFHITGDANDAANWMLVDQQEIPADCMFY